MANIPKQLSFFDEKLFSLDRAVSSKLSFLSERINLLTHGDLKWLTTIVRFYNERNYLTERQFQVLDSITSRFV